MGNKWLNSTVEAYKRYFGEAFDPIVYEVGSRDGNDGIELAERIVDGVLSPEQHKNVILFEPNPPQAEAIRKSYPNAVVLQYAASNYNGSADFLQIDGGDNIAATGSSTMDLKRRSVKPGAKHVITVETRRLDDVISQLEHVTIDIMKIDAEGYTYEILEGLGDRLKDVMVYHLETEQGNGQHPVTNKTSAEVFTFMRANGFLCYALEYEWGGIEDQVWVNAEALRNVR